MCYDISIQLKSHLKHAQRYAPHLVDEIKEKLLPFLDDEEQVYFRVSGFEHPRLIIYTDSENLTPVISTWGLIPSWIQNKEKAYEISNKTLNARIETIHEKASFKEAAETKRCYLLIDGFFEHHHKNHQKIPNFIHKKDNTSFLVAGLYNQWTDPSTVEEHHTFTIVTTQAVGFMKTLHNGAKEPRMPFLLTPENANDWLEGKNEVPQDLSEFTFHEVRPIRGKESVGNKPEATFYYPSQPDLFS